MNRGKRHLLFVDDDEHEVTTFARLFHGERFEVTGVHVERPSEGPSAVELALAGRTPDLFVLDLFFCGRDDAPRTVGGNKIQEARRAIQSTIEAAEALRELAVREPNDGKRLLREAHGLVQETRRLLDDWCEHLGQTHKGGIALLETLHRTYPNIPKVFYSRKATLQHAKDALHAGALDVLSKPEPRLELQTAEDLGERFLEYCEWRPPSFLAGWHEKLSPFVTW